METAYESQNLYQRIKGRHGQYVTRRSPYDAQRDEICERLRPDLVKGQDKTEGAFEGGLIVEGTAPYAVLVWCRGFMYNMISRRIDWFREAVPEPPAGSGISFKGNDQVNQYLQDVKDCIAAAYNRSTYYDVVPEFTLNGGTMGTPVMLYQYDIPKDRIVCEVPDYASTWIDKDIFGRDNALHVLREWDAIQAAEFFREDDLPRVVRENLRNGNHYAKNKYLQVIYGAGDRIYKGLKDVRQTHPWMEHYICLDASGEDEKVLRPQYKGPGYFSRPFSTWHYHRNSHEVYSRTMAWWAIYDIKGHDAIWEALYGDAELSIKPAFWAMESQRGLLDFAPGQGSYARNAQEYDKPPIFFDRKSRYDIGMDFADRLKQSVERHFHVPFFLAITMAQDQKGQPETAYGLMRREAEGSGQLAPQVESYENQFLGDTHDVFMDFERMKEPAYPWGALPEPPAILQDYSDGKLSVEFIGPLSKAQVRDRETSSTVRAFGLAEMYFNADPRLINKLRLSQSLERNLEALDFPQADIVPEEQYQQIMEAIDQRQQQAELAESAPKMAQAAKNLQGKTEKGSPLAMMTGAK